MAQEGGLSERIVAIARRAMLLVKTFDPNQPRDADGRWSGGSHADLTNALPELKKRLAWLDAKNYDIVAAAIKRAANVMGKDEFREWASHLGVSFKKTDSIPKIRRILHQHMEAVARSFSQVEIGLGPSKKPEWLLTGDEEVSKSWNPNQSRDADGKFGSGGGSKRSAVARVGTIIALGARLPRKAIQAAKALGQAAMKKIEDRYGTKVAKAVSLAVIFSLPLPAPGMSIILSAPIVAAAELYRQTRGPVASAKADEKPDIKALVLEVIAALFGGTIPKALKLDF